jgi:hypothetical protein
VGTLFAPERIGSELRGLYHEAAVTGERPAERVA